LVAIQVLLGQKPKKLRAKAQEAMKKKTSGLSGIPRDMLRQLV
jgi:hypothetical protein